MGFPYPKLMGRKYMGVERSTFVIDAEGNLAKVMRRVKPDTHADDVLAALPE
jgi:thioredoxin-dependent peroxiredoxin